MPCHVLVTGSSGFIGRHGVQTLAAAGHRVTGFDLAPPDFDFPGGSTFLCGDIRSDRLPHRGIDAVVHFPALPGVRPSIDRPFGHLDTNVTGTHGRRVNLAAGIETAARPPPQPQIPVAWRIVGIQARLCLPRAGGKRRTMNMYRRRK